MSDHGPRNGIPTSQSALVAKLRPLLPVTHLIPRPSMQVVDGRLVAVMALAPQAA